MTHFKEAQIIKKLSNYQKLVSMDSIKILRLANYTYNVTLYYNIPNFGIVY